MRAVVFVAVSPFLLTACTDEPGTDPFGLAAKHGATPGIGKAAAREPIDLAGRARPATMAGMFAQTGQDPCVVQDGVPLGTIGAVTADEDIVSYYSYGTPDQASYNGPFPTIPNDSMIFIYEDEGTGERSLVIVHDQPNDGAGGEVWMELSGLGPDAYVSVEDDPGQENLPAGLDGLGNASFSWRWAPCCTDGVALSDVDFAGGCIGVDPDFTSGIDTWSVVDGVSGDRIPLLLDEPIEICPQSCECLVDQTPPTIECPLDETVVLDPVTCEASVTGEATGTDECDGDLSETHVFEFTGPGSQTHTYVLTDAAGNSASCDQTVAAVDQTPPVFTPGPTIELWAPNHKYVRVTLSQCGTATDACSGGLDLDGGDAGILSVSSSEPDEVNAGGDGHTTDDAVIVDDHTAAFRGERQGAGDGRTYSIGLEMWDGSGNTVAAECLVDVPHDQGG